MRRLSEEEIEELKRDTGVDINIPATTPEIRRLTPEETDALLSEEKTPEEEPLSIRTNPPTDQRWVQGGDAPVDQGPRSNPPPYNVLKEEPSRMDKFLNYLTGGHIQGKEPEPLPEVMFDEQGRAFPTITSKETAAKGFFEDPTTWATMGATAGVKFAGPPLKKLARGATEAMGWATGGVSDIPIIAKTAGKGVLKNVGGLHVKRRPIPLKAVKEPKEIPKRSDLIKKLSKSFDVPIDTGRYAGFTRGKALGAYWKKPQVIRLKSANDVSVAAHEVGHHIQELLGFPKRMPQEVMNMASPGPSRSREGFAEFVRLYLTKRAQAKWHASGFFNDFEKSLEKHPDVKAMFDDIHKGYESWKKLPSSMKLQSYLTSGKDIKRKKLPTLKQLYTMTVDEIHPFLNFTNEAEKRLGKKISEVSSPYRLKWASRGFQRKVEQFYTHQPFIESGGRVKFKGTPLRKILKPIEDADRMEAFNTYLWAKRAQHDSRITQGFEGQLGRGDFLQTVKEGKKEFEEPAQKLYEYQKILLTNLVESGRISSEAAVKMSKTNLMYVPLYRLMEEEIAKGAGTFGKSGSLSEVASGVHRMGEKGSARNILYPTENIMFNTITMLKAAEDNRVGAAIADLADNVPGMGKFLYKVPRKMKPTKVSLDEILEKGFAPVDETAVDDFYSFFRPSKNLEKNEVVFYKNGKPQHYRVKDDELYKAITSADKDVLGIAGKILQYPASWLRAGATLSPEFILRNPARDQVMAYINSNYGYKPGLNLLQGIFHALKKDKIYQQFNASGAAHAAMVSIDRDYIAKGVDELLKDKKISDLIKNPLLSFQKVSELMEEGTRVGEAANLMARRTLKEQGKKYSPVNRMKILRDINQGKISLSPRTRAALSIAPRDLTLDFNRKGTKTKGYNRIVAFANAKIQGWDKLARRFKEKPVVTTARIATSVTAPTIALWAYNKDDPHYQELPSWRKTLFWNLPIYKDDGSLLFVFSYPKPFDVGVIFGSIPEMALNYAYTKDKEGVSEAIKTLVDSMAPDIIPTAVTPLAENFANKSFFFDTNIVQRGKEDFPPEYQYSRRTTETSKLIGKVISKVPGIKQIQETPAVGDILNQIASPAKLDNLIRGWTGNLGYMTVKTSDKLLKTLGIIDPPEREAATIADIPGIKGFIARMPASNSKSIEDFYRELSRERKKYKADLYPMKTAERMIRKELVKKDVIQKSKRLQKLEDTYKSISNMRTAIALIYESRLSKKDRKPTKSEITTFRKRKREMLDKMYYLMINTAAVALGRKQLPGGPQLEEKPTNKEE